MNQLNIFILILTMCVACGNVRTKQNTLPAATAMSTTQRLKNVGVHIPTAYVYKYDLNGLKHGLWIEDNESSITMTSYVNGMKDGCEVVYNSRPEPIRLLYIITFCNDKMTSIITFDDHGMIIGNIDSIRPNLEYPEYQDRFKYIGNDKYYKNGKLLRDGPTIFGEEWEIDCEFIGYHKIDDEDGSFTVKYYKPSK